MPRPVRLVTAAALGLALAAGLVVSPLQSSPRAAAAPGDVVLRETFDSGALPAGWNPVAGPWAVRDGRLTVSGGSISRITFGPRLANYRLEADLRFEQVANSGRWTGVMLDAAADGSVPWWQAVLRSGTTAANGLEIATRTSANAWNVPYTGSAPFNAGTGRDLHVVVEVRGTQVRWVVDGAPALEGRIARSEDGVMGLVADGATVSFDNVVVTEIEPPTLTGDEGALPEVVAHRGYSSVNPENTLAALVAGARAGAQWVETDVQTSADGVPVIMHDSAVDRTTSGKGQVGSLSGTTIAGLDAGSWFDAAFTGQRVPTLDAALAAVKRSSSDFLLEIKGPETPAEVARILDAVAAAGMRERTLVQSFDVDVLRAARAHDPKVRLGLLRSQLDADPLALSRQLGLVAYNPAYATLKGRPSVVRDLNAAGIAVFAWTPDAATDWQWLTEAGVDGIITNRPGALIGWESAQGQKAAPAQPRVSIVSPAAGARVERGAEVVLAATAMDAASVTLTLDGRELPNGTAVAASTLALGEHTVTARAAGAAGVATDTRTFTVTVTADGLRARFGALPIATGRMQQLFSALEAGDWARLRETVTRVVPDAATRERLLAEIDHLATGR